MTRLPRRTAVVAALGLATLGLPAVASADKLVTASFVTSVKPHALPTNAKLVQTFVAPTTDPTLRAFRIEDFDSGTVDVGIYAVDADEKPVGPAVFSLQNLQPNFENAISHNWADWTHPSIRLEPGKRYAFVVTAKSASSFKVSEDGDGYAEGELYDFDGTTLTGTGDELRFMADFTFGRLDAQGLDQTGDFPFGDQPLGTISAKSLRAWFTNDTDGPVDVKRIRVTGDGDFLVSGDSCSGEEVLVGEGCDVTVRFAPSVYTAPPESRFGTVQLVTTGGGVSNMLRLKGTAVAATSGGTGPQGAPGQNGVDGKDGANGQNGLDGKDGKDGAPGPQGATGHDGAAGKDGQSGQNGKDGVAGKDGAKGEKGDAGAKGDKGERGANGAYRCAVRRGTARCTVKVVKGQTGTARVEVRRRGTLIAAGTRRVVRGRVALPAGVKAGRAYRVRVTTKAGTLNAIIVAR